MESKYSANINIISTPEEVHMADDWYQHATQDHFWIKSRFRAIKSNLHSSNLGSNILEIGCGNGVVIKQFQREFDVIIDGCDLNKNALDLIDMPESKIFCLNIYDKPSELLRKYDTVLLLDVIEHIEDDLNFLKTSVEYLKSGGLVIVHVPALQSLFGEYDIIVGHKRRYSKKMMRKLFSQCGIEIISMNYWGFSMIALLIARKLLLKFIPRNKGVSTGFKAPNRFINKILNLVLSIENKLIKSPCIGTSLVAIGRVNK